MAVVPSLLYRGTLTNTNATLKTTDAIATTAVTSIVATNRTATAGWFTVTVNGFYLAYQMPVAGNQTVTIDVKQVTGLNVAIQGLANAGSTIDLSISGVVSTGPSDQAWTFFSPSIKDGSGATLTGWTQNGYYTQAGKTVTYRFLIQAGASSTYGTGNFRISLPVNAQTNIQQAMGSATVFDSNIGYGYLTIPILLTNSYFSLLGSWSGVWVTGAANQPCAGGMASGDYINGQVIYEAA